MAILKTAPFKKPIIDISGPKGNAFYLLGVAQKYAKQFDWESADIESMLDDLKSKDYKYLVETFDEYFGEVVDLNLAGIEL
tara:strand:- start:1712 stop:1954 length:243 start_codon:yes stop_codon:yes gene_type:complete